MRLVASLAAILWSRGAGTNINFDATEFTARIVIAGENAKKQP